MAVIIKAVIETKVMFVNQTSAAELLGVASNTPASMLLRCTCLLPSTK
jgi:hypothetical protein